jgi:hypothetical protein
VAPEAVAYLRAIADAYCRAPEQEWAEGKLRHVLDTERSRYGLEEHQFWPMPYPEPVVDPPEHGEEEEKIG